MLPHGQRDSRKAPWSVYVVARDEGETRRSVARSAATTRVTYVGQATVLIEMDGMRILTDPILKRWVGPLRRYGPLPDPTIHHGIDVVLISHQHLDHLDPTSLRLLPKSAVVIGPPLTGADRAAGRLQDRRRDPPRHGAPPRRPRDRRRARQAHAAALDPELADGTARLHHPRLRRRSTSPATPASSTAWRTCTSASTSPCCPSRRGGCVRPEGRHLSPRTAAHALTLLQPRIAVPIHWGTLYLPGSAYAGKEATYAWFQHTRKRPEAFAALAAEMAPDVEVRLLAPGESLSLDQAHAAGASAPARDET